MSENQPPQNQSVPNNLFFSKDESRLRAGWRLILQTIILLFLGLCLGTMLVMVLVVIGSAWITLLAQLQPEHMVLGGIVEAIAITGSVFFARHFLDRRSIESLGLKLNIQTLYDILAGIGITFLQMGFIYLFMSILGWVTFEGFAWEFNPLDVVLRNTILLFIAFVLVAWNEELLSRGYHLQTIASGLNLFWGVIISSAVFGLLHIGNPDATWVSTLGIFIAGIFFAYGYLRTKQLWLPMGMHLGWNFFEGVVFGFPVSGLDIPALARIQVHGPELWTGGPFGPEAGLIVIPALLLGAFGIHLYTARRI